MFFPGEIRLIMQLLLQSVVEEFQQRIVTHPSEVQRIVHVERSVRIEFDEGTIFKLRQTQIFGDGAVVDETRFDEVAETIEQSKAIGTGVEVRIDEVFSSFSTRKKFEKNSPPENDRTGRVERLVRSNLRIGDLPK